MVAKPFPKSADRIVRFAAVGLLVGLAAALALGSWFLHPRRQEVGYMPKQPVAFSHKLHAGDLGMDCRYCHYTVERAAMAAPPPTEICMNCHAQVRKDSAALALVRESYARGIPIRWVRVHRLPDFVYFNHGAHVASGVGCTSCHGRVDQMIEVRQVEPLNMAWCLDCHRNPAPHLRPPDKVTARDWKPEGDPLQVGKNLTESQGISAPVHCSGCHR